MKKVKLIIFLSLEVFLFLTMVSAQTTTNLLDREINIELSKANLLVVVNELANKHNIPIGIELSSAYREREFEKMYANGQINWDGDIEIKSGTLREILDRLVQQETDYQWSFQNDVVNIFPKKDRDLFLQEVLSSEVKDQSLKSGVEKDEVIRLFIETEPIKKLMVNENVELLNNNALNQIHRRYDHADKDIQIEKATVKDALNKVIKGTGAKIWVVERCDNGKYLSINF